MRNHGRRPRRPLAVLAVALALVGLGGAAVGLAETGTTSVSAPDDETSRPPEGHRWRTGDSGATASRRAGGPSSPTGPAEAAPAPTPPARVTPEQAVETALARLTPDQRIGQLFMTYTYGSGATDVEHGHRLANLGLYGVGTPAEVVTRYHLGGVILLDRDTLDTRPGGVRTGSLASPPQVAWLTSGLQAASVADSGIGLLVAVDQEGGPVTRVGPPATQFPAAAVLGRSGDPSLVAAVSRATASELAAMGINQNLAPVADVNVEPRNPVIGARSFGADPARVAGMVDAAVRGYDTTGVLATAKHFPGHGDTVVDSHVGLPVVDHTREEWHQLDRPPFAAAVAAGVPAVMTAHLSVPALDPSGTPATLSAPILDELRTGLGFGGVIITDALGMAGVSSGRAPGDVAVASLLAGADLLLMPADLPAAQDAVKRAVQDGTLPAARIDASVRRVLAMKQRAGLLGPVAPLPDLGVVGREEHQRLRAWALAAG